MFCWNRPCVFCDPLVACFCRPSRHDVRLICLLWQPRTFSVTFELWSLHYMQITTAFLVKLKNNWLMSKIDCQVRQTGTRWVDIGGRSSDRKFGGWDTNSQTVKKIKCHETSRSSGSKNITWKGILLFLMNSVLCFLAKYFSSAL